MLTLLSSKCPCVRHAQALDDCIKTTQAMISKPSPIDKHNGSSVYQLFRNSVVPEIRKVSPQALPVALSTPTTTATPQINDNEWPFKI